MAKPARWLRVQALQSLARPRSPILDTSSLGAGPQSSPGLSQSFGRGTVPSSGRENLVDFRRGEPLLGINGPDCGQSGFAQLGVGGVSSQFFQSCNSAFRVLPASLQSIHCLGTPKVVSVLVQVAPVRRVEYRLIV